MGGEARLFHGLDGVAAGFFVGLEFEEAAVLHFEEEVVEGAEAVGAFVEAGVAAFEGLLDHGTVNGIVAVAALGEGFHCFGDQVERVGDGRACGSLGAGLGLNGLGGGGGGLGRGALPRPRLHRAHEVVVIQEFVAVVDEQVGAGILDADADDFFGVLAQLADERGEVGVATDDDKGVDVALGVTKIEGIDDHADVGGIFAGLAQVGDLDEFERGFVQVALEGFAAFKVAVGLFDDDVSFEQEAFEHLLDVELGIMGVHRPEGDVLQVEEHGHRCVGILVGHCVRVYYKRGQSAPGIVRENPERGNWRSYQMG